MIPGFSLANSLIEESPKRSSSTRGSTAKFGEVTEWPIAPVSKPSSLSDGDGEPADATTDGNVLNAVAFNSADQHGEAVTAQQAHQAADSELLRLIEAWPKLLPSVRRVILNLVEHG